MKKIKTSCAGKIALLVVVLTAQGIATNAQIISTSAFKDRVTQTPQATTIDQHNLILSPDSFPHCRLGVEDAVGQFGGPSSTWASMGFANIYGPASTGFVTPASDNLYGFLTASNSDRMFYGLRNVKDASGNLLEDQSDAIIAWGDNDGSQNGGLAWGKPDKLIFSFYNYLNSTSNGNNYQGFDVAAFDPKGNFGIGTITPLAQLHTTGSVRFAGLTTGAVTSLVGIDANGNLFRTTGGTVSNSCATVNMIPKTTSTGGALGCSQVFDNGTSVGINTTSGFTYTSLANSLTGSTLPSSSGTIRLDVGGVTRSLAFIATSDERFKTNIAAIKNADGLIRKLNGKTYNWNAQVQKEKGGDAGTQYGFLAQEVGKVMPDAVIVDENGNYGINYNAFIPVLVENQKNLMIQLESEKQTNEALKASIDEMQIKLESLANCCSSNTTRTSDMAASNGNSLSQNTPNPFNNETRIDYSIVSLKNNAFIIVYNMNGEEVSRYSAKMGKGFVTINGGTMKSGMYLYALIVDGLEVATKKMVLTK